MHYRNEELPRKLLSRDGQARQQRRRAHHRQQKFREWAGRLVFYAARSARLKIRELLRL